MIVKMLITFDYDPETNEYKAISQEIVKDSKKSKKSETPQDDESEPIIRLESNKYVLNNSAAELLNAKWEDRLSIKYQKVDGITFPIIGKDETFGCSGGNKLTKSLTVSFRGQNNEILSKYGDVFTLTKLKGQEGLFVLVGNNPTVQETTPSQEQGDENVKITEDDLDDIDFTTDLQDSDEFNVNSMTFEL